MTSKDNLFDHQRRIIDEDPKRCGLFLGTGSGKTRTALTLARGRALVICPKTQKEDGNWEREAEKIGGDLRLTVVSKEIFRRDAGILARQHWDTVIVDEAHTCLGVTPNTRQRRGVVMPKTSQLYEALESFIRGVKPERVYLCTATIMRSPMTVWGAAQVLGKEHACAGFYEFRAQYYVQLPMPGRVVFAPKTDDASKNRLAALVRVLGYVGRLEDFFDVPEQTWRTDYVELSEEQKKAIKEVRLDYPDAIVRVGKQHQVENGVLAGDEFSRGQEFPNAKLERLKDYALEFPRMVVFCKYRAQIAMLERELRAEGYTVWTMTGDTKDRGEVLAEVNGAKSGIFIVQAQVSAGWEVPEVPVMIFASRTYSFVDYVQAQGRVLRANALKKNLYINLVVRGGVDEAVHKALENKCDFDERLYLGI